MRILMIAAAAALLLPAALAAQSRHSGQPVFDAISDVVERLDADPETAWDLVDVERLRQHLIDMDRVMMEAEVVRSPVPGGARFEVRGSGPVAGSIRRMALAHARVLETGGDYEVEVESIVDGVIMTAVATDEGKYAELRIRGLGFVGLLVLDDHHAAHHWMLATGKTPAGH